MYNYLFAPFFYFFVLVGWVASTLEGSVAGLVVNKGRRRGLGTEMTKACSLSNGSG
jgi:hypothetical protein